METVSAGSQIDTRGLTEPRMGAAEETCQGWEQAKKYPAPGGVCGVAGRP